MKIKLVRKEALDLKSKIVEEELDIKPRPNEQIEVGIL